MEEILIELLKEYGYIILFFWSILEGEMGLIMAGIMSYTGDMNIWAAITVASLGGFIGDQIYFYIGRFNKISLQKRLKKQRRKFALAHFLLKKYGWPIIFVQRYMYGMRTIIPMSIGITDYSARKFAIINFFSAIIWASATIVLAYLFGDILLSIVHWLKGHFYIMIALGACFLISVSYYFHTKTKKNLPKKVHK